MKTTRIPKRRITTTILCLLLSAVHLATSQAPPHHQQPKMTAPTQAPPPPRRRQQQQQAQYIAHDGSSTSDRTLQQDDAAAAAAFSNVNATSSFPSFAEHELRAFLLQDYDVGTFPFTAVWQQEKEEENNNGQQREQQRTGIPVEVGLNFHRVLSVDPSNSIVDMIVWVRQRWRDPRLQWNPADWSNITSLHFWIGDGSGPAGEQSQIWTPDLELWNQQVPLAQSLASAAAVASPNGTVFWSRPGHVQAVCKFSGLTDFPFDTLRCTLEIGSWAYSGLYLRPTPLGEGYTIGGSNTAGEAYQEFNLQSVQCEPHVYPPYVGAPLEDWPVLFYHVAFERSWQPYVRGFVTLQVILNLVAFSCFWLPPHVGERMSVAITAVLAAVASELVVASKLPAAADMTWFAKFALVSALFTAAALVESAAVIYFHYCTADDLVPTWVRWIQRKMGRQVEQHETTEHPDAVDHASSSLAPLPQNEQQDKQDCDVNGNANETSTEPTRTGLKKSRPVSFEEDMADLEPISSIHGEQHQEHPGGSFSHNDASELSDSRRPLTLKSFRASLKKEMASFRTRQSIKTILGRDADDFKNAKEMANNIRWQRVSRTMDETSRLVFPLAFVIFLSAAFATI